MTEMTIHGRDVQHGDVVHEVNDDVTTLGGEPWAYVALRLKTQSDGTIEIVAPEGSIEIAPDDLILVTRR